MPVSIITGVCRREEPPATHLPQPGTDSHVGTCGATPHECAESLPQCPSSAPHRTGPREWSEIQIPGTLAKDAEEMFVARTRESAFS
jgi:hypothetical protein